jgi:hypothetical protein
MIKSIPQKNNSTPILAGPITADAQSSGNPPQNPLFGFDFIHVYSRKQAVADGVQIDVTDTARKAGFRYPVFLTHSVWERYVSVPETVTCQSVDGRLWDVLIMLHYATLKNTKGRDDGELLFRLNVRNSDRASKPSLVTLKAQCAALDFDDPRPCITIMLPDED